MKVAEMTLSTEMPTSWAIRRFWAVARMALPSRVYLMNRVRPRHMAAVVPTMNISPEVMMPLNSSMKGRSGVILGKGRNCSVWASMT